MFINVFCQNTCIRPSFLNIASGNWKFDKKLYESFLKWGYLHIIHFGLGFSLLNLPFWGTPICDENPYIFEVSQHGCELLRLNLLKRSDKPRKTWCLIARNKRGPASLGHHGSKIANLTHITWVRCAFCL